MKRLTDKHFEVALIAVSVAVLLLLAIAGQMVECQ